MPLAPFALTGSACLLAVGAVLTKLLLSSRFTPGAVIDPLPFLTFQLFGGVVFLIVIRARSGWAWVPMQQLRRPAHAGLILGAGSICTIMALALASASEASVVFATQPVFILALAAIILGERVGFFTIALCLIAVSGVLIIIMNGGVDSSTNRAAGLTFAFISTASAALYTVWMRGLSGKIDMLTALIIVQTVSLCLSATVWAAAGLLEFTPVRLGNLSTIKAAMGTGTIYYGMAFYVYLIGLRHSEVSKAGIYLSLVPIFTIGLAWLFLDERLAAIQWLGVGIVVSAVGALSILPKHDRRQKQKID